jgi:putative phosphoesterase
LRVAVLSDIHSNLTALKAVLDDLPKVDEILCLGDLVGYAAEPNEVVELVREGSIRCVMGNHDHAAVTGDVHGLNELAAEAALWTHRNLKEENRRFLRSLPLEARLKLSGKTLYLAHGSPRDPLWEYVFPELPNSSLLEIVEGVEADLSLLGHTHVPMERKIFGKLVLNPGGVGQPRDLDPRASYMILELDGEEPAVQIRRVKYDIDLAAKKIRAAGLPEELAARLYFGW